MRHIILFLIRMCETEKEKNTAYLRMYTILTVLRGSMADVYIYICIFIWMQREEWGRRRKKQNRMETAYIGTAVLDDYDDGVDDDDENSAVQHGRWLPYEFSYNTVWQMLILCSMALLGGESRAPKKMRGAFEFVCSVLVGNCQCIFRLVCEK